MDPSHQNADPLDTGVPSAARMYDYYLGGSLNFAADRDAAAEVIRLLPAVPRIARANRAFLHRAVRFMLDQGIRQFLDIGSGIPTVGNVHEVVHAAHPDARIVYVDHDPVAVAHAEAVLGDTPRVAVVRGDLRQPTEILRAPAVRRLLDFSQPVGLLLVAVVQFVSDDDDPAGVTTTLRDAVPVGSYVAVTHGAPQTPARGQTSTSSALTRVYRTTADPVTLRDRDQVRALLPGWTLVDPGLVWMVEWRPDWTDELTDDPSWCLAWGTVGHKRA